MDDSKIVDMFLERNEQAISETAEKYGKQLKMLANGIVNDDNTAEECVNDCYLELWHSIPPNRPHNYFFAFIAKITRHIAIDRYRAMGRDKRSAKIVELTAELELCLPSSESVDLSYSAKQLASSINLFLKSQSQEKRNIFIRRYWYFDSVSDIASRFGIKESKVKTTLHRMREQLKKLLEKEGYTV